MKYFKKIMFRSTYQQSILYYKKNVNPVKWTKYGVPFIKHKQYLYV